MTTSLSQHAYKHIQGLLLNFELSSGTRVSEHTLAKKMGISRTPVREAIRRLQDEGVLYQVPSSGTYVARPNRTQIVEMYELRLALEAMAVSKAARLMSRAQRLEIELTVERMREAVHAFRDGGRAVMEGDELRRFLGADLEFHRLIMAGGANMAAYKIINDVHVRHAVFGFQTHRRDLRHLAYVLLHHARVAVAIRRRDARAARRELRIHIRQSLRDALAAFDAAEAAGKTIEPSGRSVEGPGSDN